MVHAIHTSIDSICGRPQQRIRAVLSAVEAAVLMQTNMAAQAVKGEIGTWCRLRSRLRAFDPADQAWEERDPAQPGQTWHTIVFANTGQRQQMRDGCECMVFVSCCQRKKKSCHDLHQ